MASTIYTEAARRAGMLERRTGYPPPTATGQWFARLVAVLKSMQETERLIDESNGRG